VTAGSCQGRRPRHPFPTNAFTTYMYFTASHPSHATWQSIRNISYSSASRAYIQYSTYGSNPAYLEITRFHALPSRSSMSVTSNHHATSEDASLSCGWVLCIPASRPQPLIHLIVCTIQIPWSRGSHLPCSWVAERPFVWAQVWLQVIFACILVDDWHTTLAILLNYWRPWDFPQHKDRVSARNRKGRLATVWIDLYIVGVPYRVVDP
jgi:hypothetical protein